MNNPRENYEINGLFELNGRSSTNYDTADERCNPNYNNGQDEVLLTNHQTSNVQRSNSNHSDVDCVLPYRFFDEQTSYFKDGKSKIDYILVYEERTRSNVSFETQDETIVRARKERKERKYRERFINNLRKIGLLIEEEVLPGRLEVDLDVRARNGSTRSNQSRKVNNGNDVDAQNFARSSPTIYFFKISIPWPVLAQYAEKLNVRAPLQAYPSLFHDWSSNIFRILKISNPLYIDVPNKPLQYFTCPFKISKIDRFLNHDEPDTIFTTNQRIRLVHEILQSTVYGHRKRAQIGIARMLNEEIFTGAFPLHEGPYKSKEYIDPNEMNKRQVLYQYWARWSCWYKYQPLDHVQQYFGEKIAIYFAWLGFYTSWLLPAAVVGLLVFIYGVATIGQDVVSKEICESGTKYRMCQNCDEPGCPYEYISQTCFFARLSYLFDQPGTVFYSIFVSFWAVAFLEYWKRKSASLSYHWDVMSFEEEEKSRPEFVARAPFIKRNPITGLQEPSFPNRIRYQRMAAGLMLIALMLSLVVVFVVAVIIYRLLVSIPLFMNPNLSGWASIIASSTGALANLIFIMLLSPVYEKLAFRLTQWEMHRTQTEFDNHLTFKVFIFQFFNYYSSIFYIAFFKGKFIGTPGNYAQILGLRNENCSNNGCLGELAQQLGVIMIGKQIINNAQEILWPKMKTWWHQRRTNIPSRREGGKEGMTRWELDYSLLPYEGLFEEYLEMVLQFGFITIFVAAFPLAPFFALLNNWVEIRLDAQKLVCQTRRPIPERAQNIGIWFSILTFLAQIAVISNAFLIAFTSDFLPKLVYSFENNFSLHGYLDFSLSWAPANTTSLPCRYRDFRDPNGNLTLTYWKLMFVRIAFVCIFEHVVFSVSKLIDVIVPDVPRRLEVQIKRERYLAKQALADSDTILQAATEKIASTMMRQISRQSNH
ncbi:anoctamin-7 isoform X2 [Tetranychus urticae]|uniref:Anoctamin n=1 Tax=Tetranychus urticae TaxID=32264 RepID=T1JS39_TETUR|nr:anoctamin-7 isoform X2 [Tetranychus urticae]